MILILICVLYARDEMTCTLQTQMRNGINSCQTRPETVDYCEEEMGWWCVALEHVWEMNWLLGYLWAAFFAMLNLPLVRTRIGYQPV